MPDPIVELTPAAAPAAAPAPVAAAAPVGGSPPITPAATGTPQGTAGTPGAGGQPPAPVVPPPAPPDYQAQLQAREQWFAAQKQQLDAEIQRLAPYAAIGYKTVSGQPAQPAAPAAAAPAKTTPFNIPEFPDHLKGFIGYDASGNPTEKPGAPPGTLAAYQANMNAKAAALDTFLKDPLSVLAPMMGDIKSQAVAEAEKAVLAKAGQAQAEHAQAQIFAQNKDWMCVKDASGNPTVVVDTLTGNRQYQFTPAGQLYVGHYQKLVSAGMDPMTADLYAKSTAAVQLSQQAAPATPPPAPPAPPAAPAPPGGTAGQTFLNSLAGGNPAANKPPGGDVNVPSGPSTTQSAQQFFTERWKAAGLLPAA